MLMAEIERLKSDEPVARRASPAHTAVANRCELVEAVCEVCEKETPNSDAKLAQRVIEALEHGKQANQIRGFQIDMQVEGGTVTLRGNVASSEQQERIVKIAQRIPQVKAVVNELKIRPRDNE
jgi:osmotically-inducible protein OsmY